MSDPLNGALYRVIQGDSLAVLRTLPDGCIHMTMCSPPYFNLRDYQTGKWEGGDLQCDHTSVRRGHGEHEKQSTQPGSSRDPVRPNCRKCGARRVDQQIGMEDRPDCNGAFTGSPCGCCYVCRLVAVFGELRRVLRDDGVLTVNLSDTFASDEGGLLGIPWRFALAMQAAGWVLRSSVIWSKAAPMPESMSSWRWEKCRKKLKSQVMPGGYKDSTEPDMRRIVTGLRNDSSGYGHTEWEPCPGCKRCRDTDGYVLRKGSWRPTRSHEHVFVFTKGGPYWCDGDAVRTPIAETVKEHHARYHVEDRSYNNKQHQAVGGNLSIHARPLHPLGANMRDVLRAPEPLFRLRDDLTPEQRAYVLRRMFGVDSQGS